MTPTQAYALLNKVLWWNRLPHATVLLTPRAMLHPHCYGLTIHDHIVVIPVILLNDKQKRWGKTLVHEMCHVADPHLRHGKLFTDLVEFYWHLAKPHLKKQSIL